MIPRSTSSEGREHESDAVPIAANHNPPLAKRRRTVKEEQRRSSRACLECRLAKTKCLVQEDRKELICERCERFNFSCKFVRHHRGRKPVSKLASLASSSSLAAEHLDGSASEDSSDNGADATELRADRSGTKSEAASSSQRADRVRSASPRTARAGQTSKAGAAADAPSRPSAATSSGRRKARHTPVELDVAARRRIWEMLASKIAQRGSTYMFVNKGELDHDPNAAGPSSSKGAGDAAPVGPSVQHHSSTFRQLLQPLDKSGSSAPYPESEAQAVRFPRLPDTISLIGPKDPCDSGILSLAAARRLYDYFFANINPWCMVFDPTLVSHESIRTTSAFLYTVILYLASRYIELSPETGVNSGWYPTSSESALAPGRTGSDAVTASISARLGSHARSLAVQAFALGDRAMETAIAFYLASVWKEADDHFSALYCSYAGKIMSDLPSSLLSEPADLGGNSKRPDPAKPSPPSEMRQRLRRHQQRVFLFHYIQEHALLLHFAPRPNFDRGPALLRNLLAWADDDLNTEDDCLLCADIDHMLLQTRYKSTMERAQIQDRDSVHGGSECFLLFRSFLDEIEDWHSRWEWQAKKMAKKFRRDAAATAEDSNGAASAAAAAATATATATAATAMDESRPKAFDASLSLPSRQSLLQIFKNSTIMQISSIAFRASLRDLNKVQARSKERQPEPPSGKPASGSAASTGGGGGGGVTAVASSSGSLMDDRTEEIYNTCLESALNLLYHSIQMPTNVLRHAQDLLMVLTPHAALLATYLISLPLPHVNGLGPSASGGASDEAASIARHKGRARLQRRKEYERRCLELLRGTRDHFKAACVREDDHVALCWRYIDSLLVVIEGPDTSGAASEPKGEANRGGGASQHQHHRDASKRDADVSPQAPHRNGGVGGNSARPSNWTPRVASGKIGGGSGPPSNLDDVAAQTLLNLHTDAQNGTPNVSPPPPPNFAGSFGPLSDGRSPYPPANFYAAGTGSPFPPPAATRGFGGDRPNTFSPDPAAAAGVVDPFSPSSSGNAAQQGQTPVDWTWLQSFLELPEFSWM
ncbi:uncharacterized protein PFL1_02255 [Pseudozyma flocculosa PF-1]|uniref:Zn(2)-C6 fungal-type domain-containing protein n=1 Tax=Pseudozyma flocculosa TaxID=84751 RepID=A0A5C3F8F5_9BASI|nr:uncharacterized protein PFL1_02255 [Pseudozyma flocculosa PF-1]EPQ30138.1 hypothetical protein PFL1_02255 [Pseudozyma flocculosa PF-1]SPO39935.1 uncharacterized protein PSFLO_05416 [Pseudozyma flocculosa]